MSTIATEEGTQNYYNMVNEDLLGLLEA